MKSILIVITFLGLLSDKRSCNDDKKNYIEWKEDRKLAWSDFKGEGPSKTIFSASSAIIIHLDFKEQENIKRYKSYCYFIKALSWVKIQNKYLLIHEQRHFDLGEIYRIKLKNEIDSIIGVQGSVSRSKLESLVTKCSRQLEVIHKEYDDETNYSQNSLKQELWNTKIEHALRTGNFTD